MGAFFIVKDMEDLKIIVQESAFYDLGRRLFGNIGQVGTAYLNQSPLPYFGLQTGRWGSLCWLSLSAALSGSFSIFLFTNDKKTMEEFGETTPSQSFR